MAVVPNIRKMNTAEAEQQEVGGDAGSGEHFGAEVAEDRSVGQLVERFGSQGGDDGERECEDLPVESLATQALRATLSAHGPGRWLTYRCRMTAPKPRSGDVTDGYQKAPARAMLRAIGMTDDDWDKSQVGVASSWNEVTPCNMPLDRLAKRAKEGCGSPAASRSSSTRSPSPTASRWATRGCGPASSAVR